MGKKKTLLNMPTNVEALQNFAAIPSLPHRLLINDKRGNGSYIKRDLAITNSGKWSSLESLILSNLTLCASQCTTISPVISYPYEVSVHKKKIILTWIKIKSLDIINKLLEFHKLEEQLNKIMWGKTIKQIQNKGQPYYY